MADAVDYLVGDIVPAVRIRKIFVEKSSILGATQARVKLGLYLQKDAFLEKSWLSDISLPNTDGEASSILDALYLRKAEVLGHGIVQRIKLNPQLDTDKGIYNAMVRENKGLTWNHSGGPHIVPSGGAPWPGAITNAIGHPSGLYRHGDFGIGSWEDVPVKLSALAENLGQMANNGTSTIQDILGESVQEGKLIEEVHNGKVYYVVPFEDIVHFNFEGAYQDHWNHNVGVAYYCYLDIGTLLSGELEPTSNSIIQGSVAAEVILENNEVPSSRRVLKDQDGRTFHGDWHWHGGTDEFPAAPDGYVGYMAGRIHVPNRNQPKLTAVAIPNTLTTDARDHIKQLKLASGIFSGVAPFGDDVDPLGQGGAESAAEEKLKPALKYMGKFGMSSWEQSSKRYYIKDNDAEVSKLYITRGPGNEAKGFFIIEQTALIKNESKTFDQFSQWAQNNDHNLMANVMSRSRVVELRLYRERVKKIKTEDLYKKFRRREPDEEPKKLIAAMSRNSDGEWSSWVHPGNSNYTKSMFPALNWQNKHLDQVNGMTYFIKPVTVVNNTAMAMEAPNFPLAFTFHDREVADFETGFYKYSIELDYLDGTYEYLWEKLQDLTKFRTRLNQYLQYALKGRTYGLSTTTGFFHNIEEENTKKSFKPFYNRFLGEFHPEFAPAALLHFPEMPWKQVAQSVADILRKYPTGNIGENLETSKDGGPLPMSLSDHLEALASPYIEGSPEGIQSLMRLADETIKFLSQKIKPQKIGKTPKSPLNDGESIIAQSTSTEMVDSSTMIVGDHRPMIHESYEFNGPDECFEVMQNKDVYIDFLSLSEELDASTVNNNMPFHEARTGLMSLGAGYYRNRCRMDNAKMCLYAFKTTQWEGIGFEQHIQGNIHPFAQEVAGTQNDNQMPPSGLGRSNWDALSLQGYSYLTPSIVRVSDPGKNDKNYSYEYSVFRTNASSYMTQADNTSFESVEQWMKNFMQEQQIWRDDFFDVQHHDNVLMALQLYAKNRQNLGYVDLANPLQDPIGWENFTDEMARQYQTKELYKSFFAGSNLTLHDGALHDMILGKTAGAKKYNSQEHDIIFGTIDTDASGDPIPGAVPEGGSFGKSSVGYTDAPINSQEYFRNLLATKTHGRAFLNQPQGDKEPYTKVRGGLINTIWAVDPYAPAAEVPYEGPDGVGVDENASEIGIQTYGDTIKNFDSLHGWHRDMPNPFKVWYAYKHFAATEKFVKGWDFTGNPWYKPNDSRRSIVLTTPFVNALTITDESGLGYMVQDKDYDASKSPRIYANGFQFFNFNMVSRVEYLDGYGWMESKTITGKKITFPVPKFEKWKKITNEVIAQYAELGQTLLCRVRYYDPKLVGFVDNMPIVNKYFFLSPEGQPIPPYVEPPPPPEQTPAEWESENHEQVQEWMTMLEKGMMQESPADPDSGFNGEQGGFIGGNAGGPVAPGSEDDTGTMPPMPPGINPTPVPPGSPGFDSNNGFPPGTSWPVGNEPSPPNFQSSEQAGPFAGPAGGGPDSPPQNMPQQSPYADEDN